MFITPSVPTTQKAVLEAFRDRLSEQLQLPVIVSEEGEPGGGSRQNLLLVVSPGGGRYGEEQNGGGGNTLVERSDVTVTIYSRMKLDRRSQSESATLNADRGLLVWKQKVLRAILKDGETGGWMPVNADGDYLLSDFPQAIDCGKAYKCGPDGDEAWSLDLSFSADFLWDLSDD